MFFRPPKIAGWVVFAALIAVASGGPALGQMVLTPSTEQTSWINRNQIQWMERPAQSDYVQNYPEQARGLEEPGDVILDCQIGSEGALACRVVWETPPSLGFGNAALDVASHYRAAPTTRNGLSTQGRRTRTTIRFLPPPPPGFTAAPLPPGVIPVSIYPPPLSPELIIRPRWLQQPTSEQIAAAHPSSGRGLGGDVEFECSASAGGSLNCPGASLSNELAARGFLEAARTLLPLFRMNSTDGEGEPVAGRPINVSIHFSSSTD